MALSAILKFFGTAVIGSVIARILISLGVSFVTYKGFDQVLSLALSEIKTLLTGLPYDAVCILGLADVDLAINLIFSAYSARVAMAALKTMRML